MRSVPVLRVFRVLAIALGCVLLGVVGVAGAAIALLHTSWGKEQVRWRAEDAVNEMLAGHLSIGTIEGNFFDRLVLKNVALDDASGREAFRADVVSVDFDLFSLLSKTVLLEEAVIVRPKALLVTEDDGALNVTKLVKESNEPEPPPSGEPSAWTIRLESALIHGGGVRYLDALGRPFAASGIELDAEGELRGENAAVEVRNLALEVAEPKAVLATRFRAEKNGLSAELHALVLSLDAQEIARVDNAKYHLETEQLSATFAVDASKELLIRFTEDRDIRGGVALSGTVHHASAEAPWHTRLAGRIADAPVTASATAAKDFTGGALTAAISRLNPSHVHALGPEGNIQLKIDAEAKGTTLQDLTGTVALAGSGSVERYRISKLELDAKAEQGRIDAIADTTLTGAGTVHAVAAIDTNREPPALIRADLKARLKDIGALLGKKAGVRGAVTADLHASGPIGGLLANGTVGVQRFTAGEAHLDRARLRFELTQTPSAISVRVRELTAKEKHLELAMRNAELTYASSGVLTVDRAHFDTNAGDIGLYARVDTKRLLKGPGELRLALYDLDLPRLRAAFFPETPQISGFLGGELTARIDRLGPHVSLKGRARDVRIKEKSPAVTLELAATLEGKEVQAGVEVTGKNLGKVVAQAEAKVPGDPLLPATWANVDERALDRVQVAFHDLSLRTVMSFVQPSGDVTGVLNGQIQLLDGGETLKSELKIAGVRADPLPMPLDAELNTRTEEQRIVGELDVSMNKTPLLKASAAIEHNLARLKAKGFASFLDADLDGKVSIDKFPMVLLADATEAVATIKKNAEPGTRAIRRSPKGKKLGLGTVEGVSGLDGVATANLVFKRRARETSANFELRGRDLVWVNDAPKLDLELVAALEKGKLTAKGFGRGKAVGGINLDATLDLPRDVFDGAAWSKVDESAIQKLVFQFEELKLGEADKIVHRRMKIRGTVDGEVQIGRGARIANAELELDEVRSEKMKHGVDGKVTARIDQSTLVLEIDTSHQGAKMLVGKIETSASIPDLLHGGEQKLAAQKIDGQVTIQKLPMTLLAEMLRSHHDMSGAFSGELKVYGAIGSPQIEVELDGAGAKIDEHVFRELAIYAKIDPSRAVARAKIRENRGGKLDLNADIGRKAEHREVTAKLQASKFSLGWLTALIPPSLGVGGIDGQLDGAVDLTGQLGDPDLQGKIQLVDLKIGLAPPAPMLERGKTTMTFEGRKIAMNLDGRSGDGEIQIELTADLKRLDAPDFDAKITTDEFPIAVGPKQLLLDSTTRIKGRTEEKMEIEVVVERGKIDIPTEGSEQYSNIAKLDDVTFEGAPMIEIDEGEALPKVEILVGLRKQIPIYGDEINAVADVELKINNDSGTMEMAGYATVGNGYLNLFGKRWDIQQARIDFIPGEDPRLQVELTHDFETAMVYVRVMGSPEQPELLVTSDPPIYDEAQLLMFVVGSGPNEDPNETTVGNQAAGIAANALLGEVQSKIKDELPIDMLQLELGDGAQLSRLRLGRWLTSRIFLGYDYAFQAEEDENVSEALLQYRLGRGWMVESRYGDRGNGGVDAVWVKRF
jgi:hypothetical protein